MNTRDASKIIDLAAGEGSLTLAALKRWKNAFVTTLDVEARLADNISSNQTNIIADALTHSFHESLTNDIGFYDVAICNPPFIKPAWREDYHKIINEIGASKYFSIKKNITSEVLFVSQIIRMLKSGGEAGVILPDGIFTSLKHAGLRKYLLNEHSVKKVIELPRNAFSRTEAKAHIIIFKTKSKPNENIHLQSIDELGNLTEALNISKAQAQVRMDYSHYINKVLNGPKLKTLSNIVVKRGKIASNKIDSNTLHTTIISKDDDYISLPCTDICELNNKLSFIAQAGDIVLARVGRDFYNKIVFIKKGYGYISDCLLVLRLNSNDAIQIFKYLKSEQGKSELKRLSSGVAAQHISITNLMELDISGVVDD